MKNKLKNFAAKLFGIEPIAPPKPEPPVTTAFDKPIHLPRAEPLDAKRSNSVFAQSTRIAIKILTAPDVCRAELPPIDITQESYTEKSVYTSKSVRPEGWKVELHQPRNAKHSWIIYSPSGNFCRFGSRDCIELDAAWANLELEREIATGGKHHAGARREEDAFLSEAEEVE